MFDGGLLGFLSRAANAGRGDAPNLPSFHEMLLLLSSVPRTTCPHSYEYQRYSR